MTNEKSSHILIVDDDDAICKTLSAILQAEGYQTATATTAIEAMAQAKAKFFNIALLDIRLPDMNGTQLLEQLQRITPETIKIMITGYPSLKNAVDALNFGADSYVMKPIYPAELIKTIKTKLEKQKEAEKITKDKLTQWVQSQSRKAQSSDYQDFMEETATTLMDFGLTKTLAKIYVTLVALGVASASEVAELSKVRREEVYRLMPELEKHGIITRKLKTPRKYSAVPPEEAVEILTKAKTKIIKEEIDRLGGKRAKLISKLKTIELSTEEDCSTEVISQRDSIYAKLTDMTKKAKKQIAIISSLPQLEVAYANRPRELLEKVLKTVKIRIITENNQIDTLVKQILQFAEMNNNPVELRQMNNLPFSLLIVDDKEAAWGSYPTDADSMLWTDEPTQIAVLKTSFESLWEKSRKT